MPDLYAAGDYDLAGFCVGVVEKRSLIDGAAIAADDVLIGVASSGLHSNGFSLARKIVLEHAGLGIDDRVEEFGQTVGETLLTPTRIYARAVRQILGHYKVKNVVHGIAHITGGGLSENLARIVPAHLQTVVDREAWPVPGVFGWLQQLGDVSAAEMERVFNMGLGLVLVVSPYFSESIMRMLSDAGHPNWQIGHVAAGSSK